MIGWWKTENRKRKSEDGEKINTEDPPNRMAGKHRERPKVTETVEVLLHASTQVRVYW